MIACRGKLLGVMTIGTLGLLYFMIFKEIPKGNAQIFMAVFGFAAGYYFGSSNHVEDKGGDNK